ncbi:hypothetical protein BEV13_02585 [Rickettsiella grylli]|uniref:Dot/Icm T4SS effector AnkH/LegA3 n=1 Tax=Rickettsiella grylli TaxID=59196 RepID=UPI0008FD1CEF|nr:Dot/Icm T4SS effector AnkH/LegA3 [Rickettsiella grylli]OJA00739.1 hypothetical protein BEV13_02585 [Rickettsiella grylli]
MNHTFAHEILFGTLSGVERFIQSGADIEEIDEYGFSPLIEATIANKDDIVALLLRYGADIDNVDTTGRTALHWAADNHNLSLCELLLAHHANANAYTFAGQPVLVYPLLRQQRELKKLLYRYGAQLSFAQDFIQAKLLGHRYELLGQVDIVNANEQFIEMNYEGFFLEFTLDVIFNSLRRYQNHFSSRHLRPYFENVQKLIRAFSNAQALLKYQRYTINIKNYTESINDLLNQELVLLPVAYEGHVITFIKYKNFLVRCDRGENACHEGSIVIYACRNLYAFNEAFCKQLMYRRQSREFLIKGIKQYLDLVYLTNLSIRRQRVGNCSWANIEASIPAMLFMLESVDKEGHLLSHFENGQQHAFNFFKDWQSWDKQRALEECIHAFYDANPARRATKATQLAAILFQQLAHDRNEIKQAESILKILSLPDYDYLLKSYLMVYWQLNKTKQGKELMNLLDACGVVVTL